MSDDDTNKVELTDSYAAIPSEALFGLITTAVGGSQAKTDPRSDQSLTRDQVIQLAKAMARPVDTTDPDAPELPEATWTAAREVRRRRLAKPAKEAISIRLDADVLAWFRAQGPGYQREINRLLRERMEMMSGPRIADRRLYEEAGNEGPSGAVAVDSMLSADLFNDLALSSPDDAEMWRKIASMVVKKP